MKLNWRTEIISMAFISASFAFGLLSWASVTDQVAIHWNLSGEADGYGSKFYNLLLMPLVALGFYVLLLLLPRIDPKKENYQRMQSTYGVIRLVVVVYMSLFGMLLTLLARGVALDVGLAVPLLVGALLIIIGNYLGKLRPNWFAGIRTPWTLSSRESWNKTHQLGGKVFVGIGLGLIIASLIGAAWVYIALGVLAGGSLIFLVVYSYLVWKADPNKEHSMNRR